jgi:hypothetical protein
MLPLAFPVKMLVATDLRLGRHFLKGVNPSQKPLGGLVAIASAQILAWALDLDAWTS